MYKFSELAYKSNDYDELKKQIAELEKRGKEANSLDCLDSVLKDYDSLMEDANYYTSLSNIYFSLDSSSEYWQKASVNDSQTLAKIDVTSLLKTIVNNPFFPELEKKYGRQLRKTIERGIATGGKAKEEKAKEQDLIALYQQKKTLIKINYNGEVKTEGEMYALFDSPDRNVRVNARKAVAEAFLSQKEELGQILLDLIAIRDKIAKENGFPNYLEYANRTYGRDDYGEKELNAFSDEVKKEIIPLNAEINEERRKRLGLDKLMSYDLSLYFPDGNAEPIGGGEELTEASERMYDELSPEMGKFFREMVESGSFDISSSPNKVSGMGFCCYLKRGMYPFIFGNMNGTVDDHTVFSHETGHAWQCWLSDKNVKLNLLREVPLDAVEIPSKTMELFSYPYAEYFFGDDGEKFRFAHFRHAFYETASYVQIHDLNTWIYTHVGASFDEIVNVWRELEEKYWPGVERGEMEEYSKKGADLLRNMGVYMFPRYLISYALSELCAMDLFKVMNENKEEALRKYNLLCSQGGSKSYPEILSTVSLTPSYIPGKVKELATFAREYMKAERL